MNYPTHLLIPHLLIPHLLAVFPGPPHLLVRVSLGWYLQPRPARPLPCPRPAPDLPSSLPALLPARPPPCPPRAPPLPPATCPGPQDTVARMVALRRHAVVGTADDDTLLVGERNWCVGRGGGRRRGGGEEGRRGGGGVGVGGGGGRDYRRHGQGVK